MSKTIYAPRHKIFHLAVLLGREFIALIGFSTELVTLTRLEIPAFDKHERVPLISLQLTATLAAITRAWGGGGGRRGWRTESGRSESGP